MYIKRKRKEAHPTRGMESWHWPMINHKKNIDGASYLKIKKEEEKKKSDK